MLLGLDGVLWVLALGLLLERLLPDPPWSARLPHPVMIMGHAISWLEARLNQGGPWARRVKGVAALHLLLALFLAPALALIPLQQGSAWWLLLDLPFLVVLLAQRSLLVHVEAVASGLGQSLQAGRSAVAQIVGRDVSALDEAGIARAAMESCAENASDGIIAPAFWYALAGLPGLLAYKLVNTADSMIGHRTERYSAYGWSAARLDDALNLAPARLTGLLYGLAAGRRALQAWRVMLRDAPSHLSPNAGWPEAALAGALRLRLGGARAYQGQQLHAAEMGAGLPGTAKASDISRATSLTSRLFTLSLGLCLLAALLLQAARSG